MDASYYKRTSRRKCGARRLIIRRYYALCQHWYGSGYAL